MIFTKLSRKTRYGLSAVLVAASFTLAPFAAYADTTVPVTNTDLSVPTGDPSTDLTDLANKVIKCKMHSKNIADSDPTVDRDVDYSKLTTTGEIDYIWRPHFTAMIDAQDSCVKGIKIQAQLTDAAPGMPNCDPFIPSKVEFQLNESGTPDGSAYGNSGGTTYSVDHVVHLRVAYINGPAYNPSSTTIPDTSASSTDAGGVTIDTGGIDMGQILNQNKCNRLQSTLTLTSTASYENSQGKFVNFCALTETYEIAATPAGPQGVGVPGQPNQEDFRCWG